MQILQQGNGKRGIGFPIFNVSRTVFYKKTKHRVCNLRVSYKYCNNAMANEAYGLQLAVFSMRIFTGKQCLGFATSKFYVNIKAIQRKTKLRVCNFWCFP